MIEKNNQTYYNILGISQNADENEIKKAYRKLAREYHPDSSRCENADKFRQLQEAYEVLCDAEQRTSYDSQLKNRAQNPHRYRESSLHFQSSFQSLFNYLMNPFFTSGFDLGHADLSLEIWLSPAEVEFGTSVSLQIPVEKICQYCFGEGGFNYSICPHCSGSGIIHADEQVTIHIAPNVVNNKVVNLQPSPHLVLQIIIRHK